jgi:hypothetical protein
MNRCNLTLTMTVAEYAAISGEGERAIRRDIAAGQIPHVLSGRRGLIKILRIPALRRLGLEIAEQLADVPTTEGGAVLNVTAENDADLR